MRCCDANVCRLYPGDRSGRLPGGSGSSALRQSHAVFGMYCTNRLRGCSAGLRCTNGNLRRVSDRYGLYRPECLRNRPSMPSNLCCERGLHCPGTSCVRHSRRLCSMCFEYGLCNERKQPARLQREQSHLRRLCRQCRLHDAGNARLSREDRPMSRVPSQCRLQDRGTAALQCQDRAMSGVPDHRGLRAVPSDADLSERHLRLAGCWLPLLVAGCRNGICAHVRASGADVQCSNLC